MDNQEIKISMTREEFNKLSDLLTKAWDAAKTAFTTTEPAFRLAQGKVGKAIVCRIADRLKKTHDALREIGELLQNVKDNYVKETEETTNENINEGETEND